VRLMDATTGAIVQTVPVESGGGYSFTELPDGDYFVFAGQDVDGDHMIGLPWRRWGAFGGAAVPTPVTVNGAGTYGASFTVGYPSEVEPNDGYEVPDFLPVGGYLQGTISEGLLEDSDLSLLRIPTSGWYTFETFAVDGACGFALEEDTYLFLYDSERNTVSQNDDIARESDNYCARISVELMPGTYYLQVTGYWTGRYIVSAREGGWDG